ncbi:MAG: acid phosphatase [Nitrosomonadales bacterium]|nr:acid phosphatase [Nitrosomonadales bacterium]
MTLRILVLIVLLYGWAIRPAAAIPAPHPDHVVIVIEENKSYAQIIDNPDAPYINALAKRGTLFTQSYGVTHPSQPNYLALFSGSTHNVNGNACPLELEGDNLAVVLQRKGLDFTSYAESMPTAGFRNCVEKSYYRKHNPVANWKNLAALNQPFQVFPRDFGKLPAVTLVIPDQRNDMHDGSVAHGDAWLAEHIESYAQWAMSHNSLLVVTWDEDDGSADNHVATMFIGPMVKPGRSAQRIDHYNVLRTVEEMFGLSYLGDSARVLSISEVWQGARQEN